jgi:uncharacterized protein
MGPRTKLHRALVHLHDWIWNDLPQLDFRIHFYGSRRRGIERPDSDLDLAIEFPGIAEDGEALAIWMTSRKRWQAVLQEDLRVTVQLELYRGPDYTPAIHAYLWESSEVVYTTRP